MTALPTNIGGGLLPPHIQALIDGTFAPSVGSNLGGPGTAPIAPKTVKGTAPPTGLQGFNQRLTEALGNPATQFGLNLLANSGPSTTPRGFGQLLGQAGQATAQSIQAQKMQELQKRLLEAQIGFTNKRSESVGTETQNPMTDLGKLNADLQAGRITQEQFDARSSEVMNKAVQERFENTQSLRGEFSTETKPLGQSLQSLGSARALLDAGENPTAQLAAFISTIKSIDNSTVREGELAAFNSMQGIVKNLENQLSRAKGKGFTVDMRRDIGDTINRLQAPLNELLEGKKRFFGQEAGKFNLDPESIIGSPFASVSNEPILPSNQPDQPNNEADVQRQLDEVNAELAAIDEQLNNGNR